MLSAPAVATGITLTAIAGSVGYLGTKVLCSLSNFLSAEHFVHEDTPIFDDNWNETDIVIAKGTKIFLAGYVFNSEIPFDLSAEQDDVGYVSFVSNEFSGYMPSRSISAFYKKKYTHIFNKDTWVFISRDIDADYGILVPKGHPIKFFKEKKGWVKLELADSINFWTPNFEDLTEIKLVTN